MNPEFIKKHTSYESYFSVAAAAASLQVHSTSVGAFTSLSDSLYLIVGNKCGNVIEYQLSFMFLSSSCLSTEYLIHKPTATYSDKVSLSSSACHLGDILLCFSLHLAETYFSQ